MKKRYWPLMALLVLSFAGIAVAQQYPLLDRIASKVVQKYRTSSCDELYAQRAAGQNRQRSPMEQRLIDTLRQNPSMRNEFFRRVSAPIVTKLFECGLIP
jgi:hypothetical protein